MRGVAALRMLGARPRWHIRLMLGLLLTATAAVACEEPRVETGVDLNTPVAQLPGWSGLLERLELSHGRDEALARWVDVFREGLDITRRVSDPDECLRSEHRWWSEASRSLDAIVGPSDVPVVVDWLVSRFGQRGGES